MRVRRLCCRCNQPNVHVHDQLPPSRILVPAVCAGCIFWDVALTPMQVGSWVGVVTGRPVVYEGRVYWIDQSEDAGSGAMVRVRWHDGEEVQTDRLRLLGLPWTRFDPPADNAIILPARKA